MKIKYKLLFTLIALLFLNQNFLLAQNREIVRIATYNILNYPDSYTQRMASFVTVLNEVKPDILVVQEITSQFGVDEFLLGVLGSKFVSGLFINGDDTDNAIFFKDSLFTFISNVPISTELRDISQFTLVHNFSGDTLIIYSVHLKASDGSTNEQKRLAEVTVLRNVTDNLPLGAYFMVIGDFNIYYANEPAYQKLIDQSTSGYFLDPQFAGNWHNNIAYASIHTQSTCGLLSGCPNGGSGGGMDDRFDMILFSQAVSDTGGITFIDNSYVPFGNDGQHFNNSINEPPFNIITQEVANALYNASDHLPVYAEFDFGFVTDVEKIAADDMNFILHQNYPNPFNPTTNIRFQIADIRFVTLKIYDLLGNEVITLVSEELSAGSYNVEFNGSALPSGLYIYRLITPDFSDSKKLMILK
ncbi:MAG: T9SS type A sorting domain-containing protein [Ignavibacteriaceae bacterium]|nr:T9SS type A sorting domain-containing protein [Ignavibacteriaceae bacterium]